MTIDELIDQVTMELTAACSIPPVVPAMEIRRIITIAMKWFYKYYRFSQVENFWHVPADVLNEEVDNSVGGDQPWITKITKTVKLPCSVQNVKWIYKANRADLVKIGIYAPSINIGLGITGQPYLVSYVSTIAQLGTYKTVIENFSAMMDKFEKQTVRFDYNPNANILRIMGSMGSPYTRADSVRDIVLHTSDNTDAEYLFEDPDFYEYVVAQSMYQVGMIMGRYSMNLPGGVQYNADVVMNEGKDRLEKIKEKLSNITTVDFFHMRR